MIPLALAKIGQELIVRKVGGSQEVKLHLQNLGIIPGDTLTVISENDGNLIIKVKETRLAISKEMALKIMI